LAVSLDGGRIQVDAGWNLANATNVFGCSEMRHILVFEAWAGYWQSLRGLGAIPTSGTTGKSTESVPAPSFVFRLGS